LGVLEEGPSQRDTSADRDSGSGRRKKERLVKPRDTGDDSEMVAVREEEKEGEEGYVALDRAIIASNMCFFFFLWLSRLLLSPYTFLGDHFREDVHDTV
jgi:hypothetical protein